MGAEREEAGEEEEEVSDSHLTSRETKPQSQRISEAC